MKNLMNKFSQGLNPYNASSSTPKTEDDGTPAGALRERAAYYRRQAAYCLEQIADYTRRIPELDGEAAEHERQAAAFDEAVRAIARKGA